MIAVINKTRLTLGLLLLWFIFVFLVAYLSPGLRERKRSTPVTSRNTSKPSTIRPVSLNTAESKLLDADNDGIPDAAELNTYAEQERFRRSFTLIAEMQFYRLSDQWNAEQRDCAGLVRFAWREALRRHDRLWFQKMGPGYEAIAPDVSSSDTESRLLGDKLFRTDFGRFDSRDLTNGTFSEFADA